MNPVEYHNKRLMYDGSDPVEYRRQAVPIGKLLNSSERTAMTLASTTCSESNHDQSKSNVTNNTSTSSARARFLVDYSQQRAPLDRSSSYRIRRISHRSQERAMTRPERAATFRQERRMSALKTQKRRLSKNTLLNETTSSGRSAGTRTSLTRSMSSSYQEDELKVGSVDFYRVRLGLPAECVHVKPPQVDKKEEEDDEPFVALQFAMKKKLQQRRSACSASLSPARRQNRLPRKCKSTSDTMPRLPTRSASRRQLASAALNLVQENKKVEELDMNRRVSLQERVVARKKALTDGSGCSGGESQRLHQRQRQQDDDDDSVASKSSSTRSSRSSLNPRKVLGGIFRSMSITKLKKYEHVTDATNKNKVERDDEDHTVIQLPASLCPPRTLRLADADDVSECSSVSLDDLANLESSDDDDDASTGSSYRLEDDNDDDDKSIGCVSKGSSSRRSSLLGDSHDRLQGSSRSFLRRGKRRSTTRRRSVVPSHWATTSLLDSSSSRMHLDGGRRSFTTSTVPSNKSFHSAPPGAMAFPTKIRRFAPSQA